MVRLILGDQLNRQHTWFSEQFDNITYAFFECYDEATYAPHHIQKVLGIFAGMRACLLYTSPSPRDRTRSRMPSSA